MKMGEVVEARGFWPGGKESGKCVRLNTPNLSSYFKSG